MCSHFSIVLLSFIMTVPANFQQVQLFNGQVLSNSPGQFSWWHYPSINQHQFAPYHPFRPITTYLTRPYSPSSFPAFGNRDFIIPKPIDHGVHHNDVNHGEKPVVIKNGPSSPKTTSTITTTTTTTSSSNTTPVTDISEDYSTTTTSFTMKANLKAIAVITGGVKGILYFDQLDNKVHITGTIEGLTNGLHGFDVHKYGDLSQACLSTGPHFNPDNSDHGSPHAYVRHVGDLGNIFADDDGLAKVDIEDQRISLEQGENNIIGRTITIHEGADNFGRNGDVNSGPAVGCGIIGWRNIEHDEIVENSPS